MNPTQQVTDKMIEGKFDRVIFAYCEKCLAHQVIGVNYSEYPERKPFLNCIFCKAKLNGVLDSEIEN